MGGALLLVVHAAATWAMVGLIWFVQVVHYPLFAGVGGETFPRYHAAHTRLTTRVVTVLMPLEAATALALLWRPPAGVPVGLAALGVGLVAALALSTVAVQVPLHGRLARGWRPDEGQRLVRTNWLRTALWSVRGVLAATMLLAGLAGSG